MFEKWLLQTLINLGFAGSDAVVYVYLISTGSQQTRNLSKAIGISKKVLNASIRTLMNKRLIRIDISKPNELYAVSLEEALDILSNTGLKEAKKIELQKKELLRQWHLEFRQ